MMQHRGIQGANFREIWELMRKSEHFWWITKKGRHKFGETNWKKFGERLKKALEIFRDDE